MTGANGVAYVGGICNKEYDISLIKYEKYFVTLQTISHELGHT